MVITQGHVGHLNRRLAGTVASATFLFISCGLRVKLVPAAFGAVATKMRKKFAHYH
jgi:hypothetical protein